MSYRTAPQWPRNCRRKPEWLAEMDRKVDLIGEMKASAAMKASTLDEPDTESERTVRWCETHGPEGGRPLAVCAAKYRQNPAGFNYGDCRVTTRLVGGEARAAEPDTERLDPPDPAPDTDDEPAD